MCHSYPPNFRNPIFKLLTYTLVLCSTVTASSTLSPASQQSQLTQRMDYFSRQLLGSRYVVNPLPEDPERPYPTYQMDSFDATSYVETVIAMSIAETFADFEILMNRLRYKNGDIGFMARNHFIGADWIPENTRQGLIRDITELIVSGLKPREKCLQLLMTPIDREEWFRRKFSIEIKAPVYISRLQYIPRKVIMTMPLVMARIPSATVANFVRDGRHMRKIVGTEIDVSHQGILIRKGDGRLYLRHASSLHRRVVEEDFYDFLESQKQLLGVNFQQVLMPERGR